MSNEAKAVGRYIKNDVWSASVTRGSHEIYRKDKERSKSWKPDAFRINAQRIRDGEAVGSDWLFGRQAAGMIVMGYILESELAAHRQALFDELADMYSCKIEGIDKEGNKFTYDPFDRMKQELLDRHAHAMEIARQNNP